MSLPIRKIKELATTTKRSLKEVFADIPGSFSKYRKQVRAALEAQKPGMIARSGRFYIDALMGEAPMQVIVEVPFFENGNYTQKCVRYDVEFSDTDDITFANETEVAYEVRVNAVNEYQDFLKELDATKSTAGKTPFTEVLDATVTLTALPEGANGTGKAALTAKVDIAQRADTINRNNRYYPSAVLAEAVAVAKERIEKNGYLLMDSQHRNVPPGSSTPLREAVAVIKSVDYDAKTGVVSLPAIEFVENQAGKDILALLEAGATLQVSQNGYGTSHEVFNSELGRTVEHVDYLRFDGWDLVPSGKAGVGDADLKPEGQPAKQAQDNSGAKPLIEGGSTATEPAPAPAPASATSTSTDADASDKDASEPAAAPEPAGALQEGATNTAAQHAEGVQRIVEEETRQLKALVQQATADATAAAEEYARRNAAMQQQQAALTETSRQQALAHVKHVGETILETALADYKRFNASQLALVRGKIHLGTYVDKIPNVYNHEALTEVIVTDVKAVVRDMDEVLATQALQSVGFPTDNTARIVNSQFGDVTVEQAFLETYPNAELGQRDYRFVEDLLAAYRKASSPDVWIMGENHPSMHLLAQQIQIYNSMFGAPLKEGSTQTSVATRIARIALAAIPVIWRTAEAFQVATLDMQENLIKDIPISAWSLSPTTADVTARYRAMHRTENANPTEGTLSYTNFRLIATEQTVRVNFSQQLQALVRNTTLDPVRDSIMAMSKTIVDAIDSTLWQLLVYYGLNYAKTEVETWETLTQVGTTDEWRAANRAWLPYAWVKSFDTNSNPTSAYFVHSTPTSGQSAAPTNLGFQGIELQHAGGGGTAMLYGTDYTVNFQAGSVTLTSAGKTKKGANNLQAKYTYSTNVIPWSLTPASGTQFVQHLMNLRDSVGRAKALSASRNYTPNRIAFGYELAERVTSSMQFTIDGSPSDVLEMDNRVRTFTGVDTVMSTSPALGHWIPVFQNGAVYHSMHTPFNVRNNYDEANRDFHIGSQFSGSDVPKPDSISVVAVRD